MTIDIIANDFEFVNRFLQKKHPSFSKGAFGFKNLSHIPDVVAVFLNGSVNKESGGTGNIHKSHAVPGFFIAEKFLGFALDIHIAFEVCSSHIDSKELLCSSSKQQKRLRGSKV